MFRQLGSLYRMKSTKTSKNSTFIFDLRQTNDSNRIPMAINLPYNEFHQQLFMNKLSWVKKCDTLLLYCKDGILCKKAFLKLKNNGYSDVKIIQDGYISFINETECCCEYLNCKDCVWKEVLM
jgi:rhodanese-related sulfurtransferase